MKNLPFWIGALALQLLVTACGIDEMAQYRDRIEAVRVDGRLEGPVDLEVAPPVAAVEGAAPSEVALDVTERYIVDRFADRLRAVTDPGLVGAAVADVAAGDMAAALDWRIAFAGGEDARFVVAVDGLDVEVDGRGRADIAVQVRLHGWFSEGGRKIYEQWTWHREPLMVVHGGPVYPNTPEGAAAERAYNLMVLNDMPAPVLREALLLAAEEATSLAVRDLAERTWR